MGATQCANVVWSDLGVGPGDTVICPALTFVATANAIRYTGAAPVVACVDATTKDICVVHYGGYPCDTVTTVRSPARFGRITFEDNRIVTFHEKPQAGEGWINGGYFLLNRRALDYIDGDDTIWERDPIEHIAQSGELMGYQHYGFWSCMDTL
jgi:hypothetical protein